MQKPNADPKLEGDDGNENKNNKHYILIEVKLVEETLHPLHPYQPTLHQGFFSWYYENCL